MRKRTHEGEVLPYNETRGRMERGGNDRKAFRDEN
jgi:hypothetical protein